MRKQLSKSEVMRDYGLTNEQFTAMREAVNRSAATLESANPDAKAMLWGMALGYLYDGKSYAFVMDVIRATTR